MFRRSAWAHPSLKYASPLQDWIVKMPKDCYLEKCLIGGACAMKATTEGAAVELLLAEQDARHLSSRVHLT